MDDIKIIIEYFYKITIKDLYQIDDIYYFFYEKYKYVLYPFERDEKQLITIIKMSEELFKKGLKSNIFIKNSNNELLISCGGKKYLLLKVVNDYSKIFDLTEIIDLQAKIVFKEEFICNWGTLWSKKIDYYENKINELGFGLPTTVNIFSYYIGLAENAIAYFNRTVEKYPNGLKTKAVLSHRRIGYPLYYQAYFNPLSYTPDFYIRDIAEYLKSAFFSGNFQKYDWDYIKGLNWSTDDFKILISRLLYPTYFFDLLDQFLIDKEENDKLLIRMSDLSREYQTVLKDFIGDLSTKKPIDNIDWL